MRSYVSAMTARTPSSAVPLAAQSRELPVRTRARQHDQRRARLLIPLRGFEYAHHLAARLNGGPVTLFVRSKRIFQPHVAEGAAKSSPGDCLAGAVAVEIALLDAVL